MILQTKKKKGWIKNIILKIYLLKGKRFIEDEEKSKLQPKKTIAERVKLRQQKTYDKDLSNTSSLEGNDHNEFIDIPDTPPLEGDEEANEGK